MSSTRRTIRPLALAACGVALSCLAACGGSSGEPEATTPTTTTAQQTRTTPENPGATEVAEEQAGDPSSDPGSTDSGSGSGSVEAYCAAVERFDDIDISDDISSDDLQRLEAAVSELTASAPAEIRADVKIYFGELLELAKHGSTIGELEDPSAEFTTALDHVFSYTTNNCDLDGWG